jgi:hypothetical protein
MQAVMRVALAAAVLAAAGPAVAKDKKDDGSTVGVAVEAGTMGLGLSVGIPVGERFNLRGVYHAYTYEKDFEDDYGGTYDGEFDLGSAGLMVDWYLFKGTFRLTAGFLSNSNQINMNGTDDGSGVYQVGDCTYQSDNTDPLIIDGTTEFKGSAPYVGIGWGGNMNSAPGFFMSFDLGVMMSGSPKTALAADGSVQNTDPIGSPGCGIGTIDSSSPEFQQALGDAEDQVNKETEDYELWPNVSLGLGWRF